jgi:N-acetylglucosamine transport system permease protein
MTRAAGRNGFIVSMLVVPVGLYATFVLWPYIQSFYISFFQWSGYTSSKKWIGLQNYRALFHDSTFWISFKHNIVAIVVLCVLTMVLGLFFAAMINVGGRAGKTRIQGVRGAPFFQFVFFLPCVLPIVMVGVLWQFIYDPSTDGLLNRMLSPLGIYGNWLGSTSTAFASMLAVMIWMSVGFYVVIFTAAISRIPAEFIEAAKLDGASGLKIFNRIILPVMWDTAQVGMIYIGIQALDLFALISTMSGNPSGGSGTGGPDNATQVISTYLYSNGFAYGKFGYATAMGVVLLIITLVLAGGLFRLTRRERIEF